MIRQKESLLHWNYFLALESDLENVSRYIEFSKKNERAYSIELAHLLLASASEVDVIAKEICNLINSKSKADNINSYRGVITAHLPKFAGEVAYVPRYGLNFKPWINWKKGRNPNWWQSYNNVKHHRDDHFEDANLKNVLNSMGGLLVAVFYFYKLKFSQVDPNAFQRYGEVMRLLQPQSEFMRLTEDYYPSYRITHSRL